MNRATLDCLLFQIQWPRKRSRKRCHFQEGNSKCRGIVNNANETTSRDYPCNLQHAAGNCLRTVFQGLGSCSGLRVDLRSCFCQFSLLRTWSAERASRIHHACDVPANRLRVWPSFMRHSRRVATPQDCPRNTLRFVASGGNTAKANFLTRFPSDRK